MERFVFVAAIAIAIIFGIGAVFGGPHFNFDVDGSEGGRGTSEVRQVAPGTMQAQTFTGGELRIRYAAAIVTITPEDRTDYVIEIDNSAGRVPMPSVETDGGGVLINGHLRNRLSDCTTEGGVDIRGYGEMTAADLPRITIRGPRTLNVDRGGAGTTDIGASEALNLDLSGCSTATVADVAGELNVDLAGSGQVRAASARRLSADVAGSGEVYAGTISEGADIDIAGSGEVLITSLNGDLTSDGAGSGSVTVQGGSVANADVDLAGSGDVTIVAPVQTLNVSIVGSGDVDVQGQVGSIEAEIAGSGGVSARSVTGNVRKEVWGSGDVHIGG